MSFAEGKDVAASLGFEPRQRDPESLVLPLHHEATSGKIKIDAPRCKWSAVAVEDEFMRRQSFSLRAGIRCLAVPLPLPDGFRSSSRGRERILPWYLPFRRHDSDHGETATTCEPPLRMREKPRWRSNRVPSRCASHIPDRCIANRGSKYRCRAKIELKQRAAPRQFVWLVPHSALSPLLSAEKIHTARDRGETQLNRRW